METTIQGPVVRRPATAEEAKALANPLRMRILRLCLDQALTNKRCRVARPGPGHGPDHVRTLVATGFLVPRGGPPEGDKGALEKPRPPMATCMSRRADETPRLRRRHEAMLEAFLAELDEAGPDARPPASTAWRRSPSTRRRRRSSRPGAGHPRRVRGPPGRPRRRALRPAVRHAPPGARTKSGPGQVAAGSFEQLVHQQQREVGEREGHQQRVDPAEDPAVAEDDDADLGPEGPLDGTVRWPRRSRRSPGPAPPRRPATTRAGRPARASRPRRLPRPGSQHPAPGLGRVDPRHQLATPQRRPGGVGGDVGQGHRDGRESPGTGPRPADLTSTM